MEPSQTPPVAPTPAPVASQESSAGPVIGALIIILILVLGGFYFLGAQLQNNQASKPTAEEQAMAERQASEAELDGVEADLSAMATENLDSEAASIEAALK